MREFNLNTWSEFSKAIAEIRAEYASHTVRTSDGHDLAMNNEILFRGQCNSNWELKTTLERTTNARYSIQRYMQRADSVVNEIESVTGTNWQLPPYPELCKQADTDSLYSCLPGYEYLVYLRQHGFPSPLLDWTRSPFIAAYFALEQSSHAERCAVFAFIEAPEGGKLMSEGDVMIKSMGPFITTHPRHFTQRASYTIATQWDSGTMKHFFASHQAVTPCPVGIQDILIKITIPTSDRVSALVELDDYNINHHTLFHTEDALVRSLGLRAFDMTGPG